VRGRVVAHVQPVLAAQLRPRCDHFTFARVVLASPERSAAEHQDSELSTALAACDSGILEIVTMGGGFAPFVLLNGHAEVVHSFDCGFAV
jgi:hypothetical protein